MKKIVLLNGCPEKLETLPLAAAKSFLKSFNENNDYEVVTINLYDKNIEYCTGCKECLDNEHNCCICDDLKHLLDKLDDARYIIWVAPIYSLSFPSKIKALLERILVFNIKYEEINGVKPQCKHILFSTCGFYCYDNRYEQLLKYFELFLGKASLTLLCPQEEDEDFFDCKEKDIKTIEYYEEIGKEYRVTGEVSLATKKQLYRSFIPKDVLYKLFDSILEEGENNNPHPYISDITIKNDMGKNTNIMLLFLPWIAMCLFLPLSSELAGTVALSFCSLIPILSFKYKLTKYDRISTSAAIIISLFLLLSEGGIYVASIAYFIFGSLCIGSLLTSKPISSYYFYKYYWDVESFTKNRYIRLNRIISASWGVLFILVSLINSFLMRTSYCIFVGIMVVIGFQLLYILGIYVPKRVYKYKDKSINVNQ